MADHGALAPAATSADVLTGLPDRGATRRALAGWVITAEGTAVLHIDLVRFRTVNASLGNASGDMLLTQVAVALAGLTRSDDWLARVGPDEFMIVRSGAGADEALSLAGSIQATFRKGAWGPADTPIALACRIGISAGPHEADVLAQQAETALALAKDSGETQIYHPDMTLQAQAHTRFLAQFSRDLDAGNLVLDYQPQCDADGRLLGAEALVRWDDGSQRHLPGRFLAAIEDSLLIHRLGDWVVGEVARQIQKWRSMGLQPPPISANLSPRQFADIDSNVASTVAGIVAGHGLAAGDLELELTESAVMPMPGEVHPEVEGLIAMGIPLVIDDFGTGYSSMSSLVRLPVAKMKIDRSLVSDITTDPRSRVLIEAALWMGDHLDIRCVAEGVETAEQLALLREIGCTQFQGWLFGRPLTPDRFAERWLS